VFGVSRGEQQGHGTGFGFVKEQVSFALFIPKLFVIALAELALLCRIVAKPFAQFGTRRDLLELQVNPSNIFSIASLIA
jgi:hypothetical protein